MALHTTFYLSSNGAWPFNYQECWGLESINNFLNWPCPRSKWQRQKIPSFLIQLKTLRWRSKLMLESTPYRRRSGSKKELRGNWNASSICSTQCMQFFALESCYTALTIAVTTATNLFRSICVLRFLDLSSPLTLFGEMYGLYGVIQS